MNFFDYVNQYRIKEAENLLLSDKNIKIEDVSERCGFNSISTFKRSFAKANGMAPAKFRMEKSAGR
jgi:AraC-like DNA-binding protein